MLVSQYLRIFPELFGSFSSLFLLDLLKNGYLWVSYSLCPFPCFCFIALHSSIPPPIPHVSVFPVISWSSLSWPFSILISISAWQPVLFSKVAKFIFIASLASPQIIITEFCTARYSQIFMHWRRKWQPTPVFLPGESQGRGAWWAAIYRVTKSWTRLKWLSSSSSSKACSCSMTFSGSPLPLNRVHRPWSCIQGPKSSSPFLSHFSFYPYGQPCL